MSRIVYSILIAALTGIILGPVLIPILRILKFGQNIREDGPRSHLQKSGTPTMGGVITLLSVCIATLFINKDLRGPHAVALVSTLGYGIIGLLDDGISIIKSRSLGLRAYQKIIGQVALATLLSVYAYLNPSVGSKVMIPFTRNTVDLGIWYIPFVIFVVVAIVNSVNLSDGLDGLASTVTMIVAIFFVFVCYAFNMDELSVFSAALVGACIGFLRYNSYPAVVFMGDTGSLALGGAVAALAVLTGLILYVPIVGIIYVLEALSVIIQVVYFKKTGKRIFKMSPLHHHFELSGWHETKVVATFSIVTVLFCLIGFLGLS
ncbi:phospho-N-acetylmuramoyl-pentapeptide-transferase [Oxobacter pfennigii]|uniref:Phospho-N-acetylmuramoyl-pentapeptide-transferase n=1 Tax=Oxobacter pfennigii TaxID=36849 RepID=A0A0N8NT74_9CLOT|nr:phospho-N-acetylmuramoyl-pentapeptide-transferase [Oxobacter pfennigii]KPU44040.1 phospho-N-acetylmuramoyl-pentapeptide-transferase [Oxobacter pfennigii]